MRTFVVFAFLIVAPVSAQEKTPPAGVLPVGKDGKPLNLDFETGDLRDWTLEGEAFLNQPIKGDTVHPRRADNKSEHQGEFWIGGYERKGDKPQGTLTSVPFKVTHPWGSFLVAGGPHTVTCVELVRNDTKKVFHRSSGLEEENLRRVAVDLKAHMGQEIFIRLVDKHSGHWGHVNFDDFRFHSEEPKTPVRPKAVAPPPPDEFKFAGLPPDKAAVAMTVPEGFEVTLFAGEPDIHQPIAFCLDDRARLWVVESSVYPQRRKNPSWQLGPKDGPGDKILIFEDTDGDGKFDKKKVFMENLNLVSGIEVGFGGVWIGAAPYLLYVPLDEAKDAPGGEVKVLLDGWGWQDTHETLNAFIWGPDGWLYGCHGVFTHSLVGKPGTPKEDRIPINAGVWRYHPTRHVFEVFAHGTSNPWGLDFDDHGQAFVEACVIPHCFHIIQGARYHRQAGPHFNAHTYDDIKTIADHRHYVGANPHGGNNRSDSAGGGHAHCGLMCYLGGTWPDQYRNSLFMGNIHGRRLNVDLLKPRGSGYVAEHGKDFLLANDAWARFINMRYGPDGNVYLIDWYDKQACHHTDPKIWDKSNGRIYKISFRGSKWEPVNLRKKSDKELAELQLHDNDWYVRHARRILQERAAGDKLDPEARGFLEKTALKHADSRKRLRAIWALHVTGRWDEKLIRQLLGDPTPFVRGWMIQLALEEGKAPVFPLVGIITGLGHGDPAPIVRRYVASALLRDTPLYREPASRYMALKGLLAHEEDNADHNLPLMYWYAAEPLAQADPNLAIDLALKSKVNIILPYMVRRLASTAKAETLELVLNHVSTEKDKARQHVMLDAVLVSLKGRPKVAMPGNWPRVYATLSAGGDEELKRTARALAVAFGDAATMADLRKFLADSTRNVDHRKDALATLLAAKDPGLGTVLLDLLNDDYLRGAALRGLPDYDHPETAKRVLFLYKTLPPASRREAVTTLAARATWGHALMDAVAKKEVASADVTADIVRQLRNLGDKPLLKKIEEVWGVLRDTPADRAALLKDYKKMVLGAGPAPDVALGRAIFRKVCYQCHKLFGEGGTNGPEITGANRSSIDYLLENMLDPSAAIPKEYATTIFELESGRFVTGILKSQTDAAYQVATATETLTIPKGNVASMKLTNQSLMPDDQLKPMSPHEVRSLVAYLQSPGQTPMLATSENAGDLFNGKDLSGWAGDMKLWSVEKGDIVGKSPGIKHNSFLRSQLVVADFRLTLKVKLTPNKENSGIQFRSEELKRSGSSDEPVDIKGYQADVGAGWWGKLYEEHGRELLWKESGEKHVKVDEWNEYKIEAVGSRIKTWINGQPCVDLDDPKGARRGILAFQIHSGGAMEVRFKELRLEVLTPSK